MADVELIHVNHKGVAVGVAADEVRIQSIAPYKMVFDTNGSLAVLTELEDIDVLSATKIGDGTITYEKAIGAGTPSAITVRTTFAEGDRLIVTCSGLTEQTTVRIPRLPVA